MSILSLAVLAAESGAHAEEGGANPWVVGGVAFGILAALLVALVAFASGREHS
jgi:hypothetical protein